MQSVDRIATILSLLSSSVLGLGVTELYEACELPKSTLHRILNSLVEHDFVIKDSKSKKYRLGSAMLRMGVKFLNQNDTRVITRPYLEKMAKELDETVYLAVLQGDVVVCVDVISSLKDVHPYVMVGNELPFNASSAAKSILAYQNKNFIEEIINSNKIQRYTKYSITNSELLQKHLATIRILGYSICEEEMEDGVISIGAPIWDWSNKVVASIGTIAPENRLSGVYRQGVIEVVKATAQAVTEDWGLK